MSRSLPRITLLGPQRFEPDVAGVFSDCPSGMRLAVISAGWQERESELVELDEHLRFPTVNLSLYRRADSLFGRAPDFHRDYRERQWRLRRLQMLYRARLDRLLDVARMLMRRQDHADLIELERESAIADVRRLDEHHVSRIREIHAEFNAVWPIEKIPGLIADRSQIEEEISGCGALCIAGGHVVILLNRLRLFAIKRLLHDTPVVAWSAGAMAISERIVLFHDRPPQGPGNPELIESGLGLHRGLVALPHAQRRLQLDDPIRVQLFAQRFAPSICLALDPGSKAQWDGNSWCGFAGTQYLHSYGDVRPLEAACR